jgi:hypothetical protein
MYAITRDDAATARVSVSTDGGSSWSPIFARFQNPYQIVVSPTDPKTLLVAAGTPQAPNSVYASHDGGRSWREASGLPKAFPLVEQYFPAHRFYAAFEPKARGVVLLADHDPSTDDISIFRSVDGARTFADVSTLVAPPTQRPWPNFEIPAAGERLSREYRYYAARFYGNRLAFDPEVLPGCKRAVVLTTRFGAFESFDDGARWNRIDTTAIPHQFIGATWVRGALYLASFGGGVIVSRDPGRCR